MQQRSSKSEDGRRQSNKDQVKTVKEQIQELELKLQDIQLKQARVIRTHQQVRTSGSLTICLSGQLGVARKI